MDFAVDVLGADEVGLALDGFAGVFVVAGAVAGDEECSVLRFRRAGKGMLVYDFAGAAEEDVGHAVVCADRAAVVEDLGVAALNMRRGEDTPPYLKAEFTRDDFFGEVAFADEEGHDEDSRGEDAAQDAGQVWLNF